MQRVSALLPSWDKSRPNSSLTHRARPSLASLDKVFGWAEKSNSKQANRNSSPATTATGGAVRFGRETYWPTTLDRECDKAARILKSFCTDGFLAQEDENSQPSSPTVSTTPKQVTKKIPPRIIQNAVGLAIFSCMRSGLWMSGSGGSGILIARKADGTWSPPSGILLHTAEVGFVIGVDIYDCVLVINSVAALEMFTRPRVTLGSDVNLTVGPLINSGLLENDIRWKELNNTVLTYLKARGKHQDVRLDGSIVTGRGNENERFYAGNVDVLDILAGNIKKSIPETRPLFEVIKAAEGRTDYDTALMEILSQQPAPGDAIIETPGASPLSPPQSPFGIPNADDPDPFGVIALEMAGLEIREAGTRLRPQSSQFEYNPAPTSPVFSKFSRQSTDTYVSKSNRGSFMSNKTQATAVTDACTQTDDTNTPDTTLSHNSDDGQNRISEKLPTVQEPEEVDYTKIDLSSVEQFHTPDAIDTPVLPERPSTQKSELPVGQQVIADGADKEAKESDAYLGDERDEDADDEDEDEDDDCDDAIVYEVATAAPATRTTIASTQATQVIHAKGALVTIPKRIPPPLPARSPARASRASKSEYGDVSGLKSPLRTSFQSQRAPTPAIDEAAAVTAASTSPSEAPAEQPEAEKRWSTGSNHSNSSPVPAAGETASSSPEDESEREPKTPKAEVGARSNVTVREKLDEDGQIDMMAHGGDSKMIPVA